MIVAGVDYSLTSPAICVHSGTEWSFSNCEFYYMVKSNKFMEAEKQFHPTVYPSFGDDIHRFDNLSSWSLNIISKHGVDRVFIEGYAFGAVGRVFQIAENAGLLKYLVSRVHGIPYQSFAPTVIKKFATGKGNANKEKMYDAFFSETGVDIREKIGIIKTNQWNPVSDIVDAYYIAKYGFMENQDESEEKERIDGC